MSLSQPEMVVLDLDGTLVDSVPDLAYSLDKMLQKLGMPAAGEMKTREWVGNGIEPLVKRALTNVLEQEPDASLFNKALPLFINEYKHNACIRTRLYDGVREGLDYLMHNDFKIACVTNKQSQFTNTVLKTLGIQNVFGIVISGDTLSRKKPDPLPLLHAAEYFNIRASKALMIGDSVNDIQAARAAGFQVLCVSYGYDPEQDIQLANPDLVIDSLAKFPDIFQITA